jgi:hypothetical protein
MLRWQSRLDLAGLFQWHTGGDYLASLLLALAFLFVKPFLLHLKYLLG